jgi:hypothetical protein
MSTYKLFVGLHPTKLLYSCLHVVRIFGVIVKIIVFVVFNSCVVCRQHSLFVYMKRGMTWLTLVYYFILFLCMHHSYSKGNTFNVHFKIIQQLFTYGTYEI